jgi:hypothetical protein
MRTKTLQEIISTLAEAGIQAAEAINNPVADPSDYHRGNHDGLSFALDMLLDYQKANPEPSKVIDFDEMPEEDSS